MTEPCTDALICGSARGDRAASFPRSLRALAARGLQLHQLAEDAEVLTLILPLFERASATTLGPHALLSERGAYAAPRLAGTSRHQPKGRIALALASGRGERIILSAMDRARRIPAALHLFDRRGFLLHRCEVGAPEDLVLWEAIRNEFGLTFATSDMPVPLAEEAPSALPFPPFAATGGMRGHHDRILLDAGTNRAAALARGGEARSLDQAALPGLFRTLCDVKMPFTRTVIHAGCMQSHSGRLTDASQADTVLLMRSGKSLMALDLAGVAQCWLLNRPEWAAVGPILEVHDSAGACIALFSEAATARKTERQAWADLLSRLG